MLLLWLYHIIVYIQGDLFFVYEERYYRVQTQVNCLIYLLSHFLACGTLCKNVCSSFESIYILVHLDFVHFWLYLLFLPSGLHEFTLRPGSTLSSSSGSSAVSKKKKPFVCPDVKHSRL